MKLRNLVRKTPEAAEFAESMGMAALLAETTKWETSMVNEVLNRAGAEFHQAMVEWEARILALAREQASALMDPPVPAPSDLAG